MRNSWSQNELKIRQVESINQNDQLYIQELLSKNQDLEATIGKIISENEEIKKAQPQINHMIE